MSDTFLVQAAILGPAASGAVWLALARWPWVRRVAAGLVALAAHGAGWAVLWLTYRGDGPAWRSFGPDLLGASVVVAAEVAILLAAVRAEALGRWAPGSVCGLAAATTAIVGTAFAGSLAVQAVMLPIPTLAAAAAALAGGTRPDLRGLLGLAGADVAALLGFSVIFARIGATAIGPEEGVLGASLLVAAGAVKAGAVPGVGTWRLAGTEGPGAPVSVALRGQGMVLALVGGLTVGVGEPSVVAAGLAAAAVMVGGAASVAMRSTAGTAAGISGAAAALTFVSLGLGGAVGTRATLVLFPGVLLASGAAFLMAWSGRAADPAPTAVPGEPAPPWRWLGTAALAVVVLSLAGLPPGGGFPGAWLTLSLAGARGVGTGPYLLVAGAAALGLALASLAAVAAVRAARTGALQAVLGAAVAGILLYMGLQPVRLGIGWWLRIERDLGVAEVLAASGAPSLPPVGGLNLALVLTEALLLVGVVVALGRGFRQAGPPFVPIPWPRPAVLSRLGSGLYPVRDRLTRAGVGLSTALLLEVAALGLAARLVLVTARAGFL